MSHFTCINCSVRFADAEIQRDHYKTDWHRYNLKRRIAILAPVTAEEFAKRVIQQRSAEETAFKEAQILLCCSICHKQFNSQNAHENHINSKKHKETLARLDPDNTGNITTVKTIQKHVEEIDESNVEEVDSDEWDEFTDNPIEDNNCMFCNAKHEDFLENLKHMSIVHSFFLPDPEYCTDVKALLMYLGEKIARDFICIWCNDKGKTFYSLDSVQKHMRDKGHCQMLHEGLALAEYAEFYDYSASYPDHQEGMDIDAEIEVEPEKDEDDGEEYQLVLPSGAVVGHRSLMRYYKQRLNPNRALVHKKTDKKLHRVLAEYKSLGWTATQQESAAKKARDIHFMKRRQSRWTMMLGCKANKLQHHYREQVNF